MTEKLFKAAHFAGMGIEVIVRTPYERQRRRMPKTDQRVTRTERGLLAGLSLTMFLLPLVYSFTKWLDFTNCRLSPAPSTKARAGSIGTILLGAAVWLFWRSHRDLSI